MGALKPIAYAEPGASTSPRWSKAFAQGCGGTVQNGGPLRPNPMAFWGSPLLWPLLTQARKEGQTWFYGDHAFFGRGQFYRCAKNTFQFDGLSGDDDPKRFRSFGIPVRDWRRGSGPILLCPQSDTFFRLHGFRQGQWIEEVTRELRKHTDRPLAVRWKKDAAASPISEALKSVWAVVTFMSNAAVDAILAGVPAVCTAPCAGLSMSTSDLSLIENLPMPDGREQWAARLANNQWSLAEMARGDLWRKIGEQ
jgi:hypothetical protein